MTREKPGLRVDHGVPSFAAHTPAFTALCERLVETNALQRCGGGVENGSAFGVLTADGRFEAEDAASAPNRYRAPEGKGINSLCDALLRGGDGAADAPPIAHTSLSTMVSKVEPIPLSAGLQSACGAGGVGGWRLTSNKGEALGDFDWLVVTSTAIGHPRWRAAFGGEPPLVEAAAALGDTALDAALAALAPLSAKPVTACLLAYEAEAAAAVAALPFFKARVDDDDTLARIVVQRVRADLTTVVLHSTHEFAHSCAHVYGATSTAARIAGASSDEGEESRILAAMLDAAERRLAHLLGGSAASAALRSPAWGPHLHRWGSAFPDAPLLPEAHSLVPSARVAFCGDFVEIEGESGAARAGSVEGAALSGLRLAEQLQLAM